MRKLVVVTSAALIVALLAYSGCDKGIEPEKPPKNPREYTWTVDTLIAHPDAIQTQMWDIYATSPENVYVAGHTDWTGVNGDGILWRYDGTKWSIVNQGFRDVDLESITGFGPSDIYAAGNKGPNALVLHFDGTRWSQQTLSGKALLSIRGDDPTNLWTGGILNSVFRFDGTQWNKTEVSERLWFKDFAFVDGKTYALSYTIDDQPADTTWWYFLTWNGARWDTLNTYTQMAPVPVAAQFGLNSLSVIDGELYSAGIESSSRPGLFKMVSGKWVEIPGTVRVAKVFGVSKNNIFAVGTYGTVYHYNGSDWYQFEQFKSDMFHFWSGWTNGNEVFIVGNNFRKSIVLHGK